MSSLLMARQHIIGHSVPVLRWKTARKQWQEQMSPKTLKKKQYEQEDHLPSKSGDGIILSVNNRHSVTDNTPCLPVTSVADISRKTCVTHKVITASCCNARRTEAERHNSQLRYHHRSSTDLA